MTPTNIEKTLSRRKKRQGVLVPLIEDFMQKPVRIENSKDADFVRKLVDSQINREERRKLKNNYSPSSLARCLRQVYLARHYKELGLKYRSATRIEPNFYFLTGEWLHLKWQYVLYKMDKHYPDEKFRLLDVEVPVTSKHGDHTGTVDAIFEAYTVPYIGDFKGVNVRDFGRAEVGDVPMVYKIQIAGYQMLTNVGGKFGRIEKALLVYENKGGPTPRRPIALCEVEVAMKDHLPEIKFRIGELREHEKSNSIPEPECTSTKTIQFLDCPFRDYCKKEIQRVESRNAKKLSVAVPEKRRTARPRRSKSKK